MDRVNVAIVGCVRDDAAIVAVCDTNKRRARSKELFQPVLRTSNY